MDKVSWKFSLDEDGTRRLRWLREPRTVFVVKKPRDIEVAAQFWDIVTYLRQDGLNVLVESYALDETQTPGAASVDKKGLDIWNPAAVGDGEQLSSVDCVVCLGGDGTLLYVSSLFQSVVPPVIPFHMGSMGFLMTNSVSDFKQTISHVLKANEAGSNVGVTLRRRLKCEVVCNGSEQDSQTEKPPAEPRIVTTMALNEVVIDRGLSPYLTGLELLCNGRYVADIAGDGLIIATPTGSTAYAAAAGGPIVDPAVPGIVIVPICPHSLSFRPIVVGEQRKLEIHLPETSRSTAWVSCDGRNRVEIKPKDRVHITMCQSPVPCVNNKETTYDWFSGLARCLHWNVRQKQKPFT